MHWIRHKPEFWLVIRVHPEPVHLLWPPLWGWGWSPFLPEPGLSHRGHVLGGRHSWILPIFTETWGGTVLQMSRKGSSVPLSAPPRSPGS